MKIVGAIRDQKGEEFSPLDLEAGIGGKLISDRF
jgi:hypothetical protein